MEVKVERYGHAAILNCKGELTADTLEVFTKEVEHQLSENVSDMVLDLGQVSFVDSEGLEYLLDMQDRLIEKKGQMTLSNLDPHVEKILEVTRLGAGFEVATDVAEAVKAM